MTTKNAIGVIVIALASGGSAWAQESNSGLFIEPAVTMERGALSIDYPTPFSNSTGRADGFGLGARLGFHVQRVVFAGVDARYSMPQYTDSSVSYDARAVSTNWAAVLGVQTPVLGLRVWGSVILGGEFNPEAGSNFDVNFRNATGYRAGAGVRLAFVSLNLEYQQLNYDEALLERIGPFSANSSFGTVKAQNKSWVASVSFPIEM